MSYRVGDMDDVHQRFAPHRPVCLQSPFLAMSGHVRRSVSCREICEKSLRLRSLAHIPMSSCVAVMLNGLPSRADALVRPAMACLDMLYAAASGLGVKADRLPLLIILQSGANSG